MAISQRTMTILGIASTPVNLILINFLLIGAIVNVCPIYLSHRFPRLDTMHNGVCVGGRDCTATRYLDSIHQLSVARWRKSRYWQRRPRNINVSSLQPFMLDNWYNNLVQHCDLLRPYKDGSDHGPECCNVSGSQDHPGDNQRRQKRSPPMPMVAPNCCIYLLHDEFQTVSTT